MPIQVGSFAGIRTHLRLHKLYGRLDDPIVCRQETDCNVELPTVYNYLRHLKNQHDFDLPSDDMSDDESEEDFLPDQVNDDDVVIHVEDVVEDAAMEIS